MQSLYRLLSTCILASLLACGSAAEFSDASPDGTGGEQDSADAQAPFVSHYNAMIDVQNGTTQFQLVSAAQQVADTLAFSSDSSQFLADTLGVTFNVASWNSNEYDSNNNQIYLDGGGTGACVTNASSTQYVNNVKVVMSLFKPNTISVSDGATSTGSTYVTDYGTIPPSANGAACTQPRFSNPGGTNFYFAVDLQYGNFVSNPTIAIDSVSSYNWYIGGAYTINGTGFTTTNCNIFLGGTLINYDSSVSLTRSNTQITVTTSGILPGTGQLKVYGGPGCASFATAGFVRQDSKLTGNFQRSVGQPSLTTNLMWFYWDTGTPTLNATTKCPTSFTDQARQSQITMSTSSTALAWKNMHSNDVSGLQGYALYLDVNRNGAIDTGDQYISNFCVGCSSKGRIVSSGGGTINPISAVTASCGF